MPTYRQLKRLSYAHSSVYGVLLLVWLLPGRATATTVFGWAHGLGWIAMSLLALVALRRRTIPMTGAVLISIVGAVGPFVGSGWFALRDRRARRAAGAVPARA